ncbi:MULTISPECIES: erythromycin esterase family protein [unclassified Modestobacter]|uniref:erythromycin esterase family protein n=1 Tax=unclassified Modestobacter TaxID=2643866 RepID=UPI0022AA8B12|nr:MULTISPECIES: erythromycin esterase family protein [unclassified Modestobacter]MCZ2826359.1 erythromycin esterase family protein [Modestobacter sp. VKM Ac-2981]MCZ2852576.1 erythromycin esterase family protein [Modestobacter sp. VKM Ac-2982]
MTGSARDPQVRELARPLRDPGDLDPLLERIGSARIVLLGEASHGTHEYYAWRAALTRRLVTEAGFSFVAVEGDWPDCHRVNCSVTLASGPEDPREVLQGYARWPTWMWANEEVADLTRWLREHNAGRPRAERVGFHGLDVYSLWESLQAVLDHLREHDPEHVATALAAFRCFEPYAEDPQAYARATRLVPTSCEDEVVALLGDLRARTATDGRWERDAAFDAEQNARAAAGAEAYYRAMVRGGPASWNVRDVHMADTLDRLLEHHGPGSRAVVWEHNTHVGDARYTDMADAGMVNVGQLARERHGADDVVIVGFGSHHGSVIAADEWGAAMERMPLPPARPGSVEALLHDSLAEHSALFVVPPELPGWLAAERAHRAVGVVYHPGAERWGNYVPTVLGRRYDAFCWFDESRALTPLHDVRASGGEQETWPDAV